MDKGDLIERLKILNAGLGNVVPKHTETVNDAIAYIETNGGAEVPCSVGLEGPLAEALKLLKLANQLIDGRDKGEPISNGVEFDIGTFNIEYEMLLERKAD